MPVSSVHKYNSFYILYFILFFHAFIIFKDDDFSYSYAPSSQFAFTGISLPDGSNTSQELIVANPNHFRGVFTKNKRGIGVRRIIIDGDRY